jgi:D-aspartate ligase
VLLASGAYGGTLAATRNLGTNGIPVSIVKSNATRFSAAAWSRYVTRAYAAPRESDTQRFLNRILAIGAARPGQLLLASSDETAYLYSKEAAVLGKCFRLYQPPLRTIQRILDKTLLEEAAVSAGLAVVPTWTAQTIEELKGFAAELPYPILIKPRTHVHRKRNDKGVVVNSMAELIREYEPYVSREQLQTTPGGPAHALEPPILQQFILSASHGVYSVSGFIDRSGELFVTRQCVKVYQRSQPVGVGVCFQSLPDNPALSSAVHRLCKELGYFGMFEVEFLRLNDDWAIIDFNPRLFNQIGMDVRRGMPLPMLAYLDATNDAVGLREAVAAAQRADDHQTVFCDGFTLRAILLARKLTRRISPAELHYWQTWMQKNAANLVDVAIDETDRVPARVHALSEIYLGLKAIPKFLRLTPRTKPGPAHAINEEEARS